MSSPPAAEPASDGALAGASPENDMDAEMVDAQQAPSRTVNGTSSNMNTDAPAAETQPTSSGAHHNRKDATLREFLSKMDEYAPIVWPTVQYLHALD